MYITIYKAIYMKDADFKKVIIKTQQRENYIGSALSRHFKCSIKFNESDDLKKWDYILYSAERGWAHRIEQGCDFKCNARDPSEGSISTLYFELYTYLDNGKTKDGKLLYTKSNKFVYNLINLKEILILDTKTIRNLVSVYQREGVLQTTIPSDFSAWKAKHGSLPTQGALIPYKEILTQDPSAKLLTYDQLDIQLNQDNTHH